MENFFVIKELHRKLVKEDLVDQQPIFIHNDGLKGLRGKDIFYKGLSLILLPERFLQIFDKTKPTFKINTTKIEQGFSWPVYKNGYGDYGLEQNWEEFKGWNGRWYDQNKHGAFDDLTKAVAFANSEVKIENIIGGNNMSKIKPYNLNLKMATEINEVVPNKISTATNLALFIENNYKYELTTDETMEFLADVHLLLHENKIVPNFWKEKKYK